MFNKLYDILEEPSQASSEEEIIVKTKPNAFYEKDLLISIIADEDTCVGFLLGGIGQMTDDQRPNYFVINRKTKDSDIEKAFKEFTRRIDIGMILISREAADMIHCAISAYKQTIPIVMQIPGIYGPYEFNIDGVLNKADVSSNFFTGFPVKLSPQCWPLKSFYLVSLLYCGVVLKLFSCILSYKKNNKEVKDGIHLEEDINILDVIDFEAMEVLHQPKLY